MSCCSNAAWIVGAVMTWSASIREINSGSGSLYFVRSTIDLAHASMSMMALIATGAMLRASISFTCRRAIS
jgi:hypothetical protein